MPRLISHFARGDEHEKAGKATSLLDFENLESIRNLFLGYGVCSSFVRLCSAGP